MELEEDVADVRKRLSPREVMALRAMVVSAAIGGPGRDKGGRFTGTKKKEDVSQDVVVSSREELNRLATLTRSAGAEVTTNKAVRPQNTLLAAKLVGTFFVAYLWLPHILLFWVGFPQYLILGPFSSVKQGFPKKKEVQYWSFCLNQIEKG